MKLIKLLLIITTTLTSIVSSCAQNMSIGARTGVSYFTVNNDEIDDDTKYTMGLNLAIPIEIRLTKNFAIQPELNYTQKGVMFEDVVDGKDVEMAVKTNFFEFPVLFKFQNGGEKFNYAVFAGPSTGYATKRFFTEKIGDGDKIKTDVDFIDEGEARSQRWELAAVGGVSGSLKAGIGSIVLDVRYSMGLTDNTKFDNDKPADWKKTTNSGCILSLGYTIPLGK